MKLSQFKFKLPEEKIALHPTKYRDESRLLVLHRKTGEIEHKMFKDVLDYFDDKDVFIFNDTKVFPARLYGNKEKTGARIEVFLLRELNEELRLWDVLVDPARKIRIGNKLYFGDDDSMVAEVIDNTTSRGRTLRFLYDGPHDEFKKALYALGETSCTGLHGANRLASNSLIEAVVYADQAAKHAASQLASVEIQEGIPDWDFEGTQHTEEMLMIIQSKREMQTIMSNYVGIVRSDLRLKRAWTRLDLLYEETEELHNKIKPNRELCELRNMIAVAYLVIKQGSALKESVGCHYNSDYPKPDNK